jgi:hypothetical protein
VIAVLTVACGKKGPPLPPLVRLPAAPVNITADRRGDTVDITFTVPDTNTDRSKPANIERVDVYAITAPPSVTDEQLLKRGTKIGSVAVKSPKDPNDVVEEDEVDEEVEPASGPGLDQGVTAHLQESLTQQALARATLTSEKQRRARAEDAEVPLLGPALGLPSRTYAAVGVSSRGKPGPFSKRVVAPLIDPPPAPRDLRMSYTDAQVDLKWQPIATPAPADEVLPSRPLGMAAPVIGYNVYDVSSATPVKVNKDPLSDPSTADPRIAWGERRCYVVRAVASMPGAAVESAPSPQACDTLKDTFPPAAPKGLRSVAGEGTINLIWDPNTEADLGGYVVYRGTGGELTAVVQEPIAETSFTDRVQPGVHFVYAIRAVDKAGNVGPFSERVDETARD